MTFHRKRNLQYFDVSVQSNYQYENLLVWILRTLTVDPNLYLVKTLALNPFKKQMDQKQIQQLINEWKEVENAPLVDDEDEDFK